MKKRSGRLGQMRVTADGRGVVSHAGAELLRELAGLTGLIDAWDHVLISTYKSVPVHYPGSVLADLAVAIADGADCLADIAALKEQEDLFSPVASVATAWRAVHATAVFELRAIPVALATARERVWAAQLPQGPMIWDFDSTLLNVHSEKEDAAPTYSC